MSMGDASSFKVGDTVKLNSGGPIMTITSIGKRYEKSTTVSAWCTWFKTDNETMVEVFPLESIKRFDVE